MSEGSGRDRISEPTALKFVASSPRGFGDLLAAELRSFGATDVRERALGVEFSGPLAVAYRACLESRVASRVFLVVADFDAPNDAAFYEAVRGIDWLAHIDPSRTLACDFTGKHPAITHTRFGALRLKDGICDQLRDATGRRPDIAPERPAVRVHAHANGPKVTVSIDLSGEGLHRRGYRTQAGEAPLRENLAAGILLRAGWPEKSAAAAEFLDPMCGSGTLVIEAAMIAAGIAPGARRHYFGFFGWMGHDRSAWDAVKGEAQAREHRPAFTLRGVDADAAVLEAARENAARAGVAEFTSFERGRLADSVPRATAPGFLATNPPYGVRLEDRDAARALMKELGAVLRANFGGWDAAILAGSPDAGLELGIRAERVMSDNGNGYVSHAFADACRELGLRHLRTRPYTPRTNGKAERFIQTMLREWAYTRPYRTSNQRTKRLVPWLRYYNRQRPHSALRGLPPHSRIRSPR